MQLCQTCLKCSSWNGFCTRWTNCQDNCQGSKCNFCSDPKICKSVIKLLCFLSEGGSQEVSRFLLNKNKLQLFVSFLEDDSKGDVQAATAGILANLPASDSKLTATLIEYEALPAIIKVIQSSSEGKILV
jgi:hypothetical protein